MNETSLEYEIFKRQHPKFNQLEGYGFEKLKDVYTLEKELEVEGYKARICIDEKGKLTGGVFDEFDEEYTNFRLHRKLGSFAAQIKSSYVTLLEDICEQCFQENNFIFPQSNRLAALIKEDLGDEVEHSFKDSDIGVFRHQGKKWYALIMAVDRSKITSGEGEVEILNVKLPPERIVELTKQKGYYPSYHMNKTHWLSIILDETLDDDTVMDLIKTSYILTSGHTFKKENHVWLIPSNFRYYDPIAAFSKNQEILWKQSSNIEVGDTVFMYVSAPYSAILFRCTATQVWIPYQYQDKNVKMKYGMMIRLEEMYDPSLWPLKRLKDYGVTTVRGPRYMPEALYKDMMKK